MIGTINHKSIPKLIVAGVLILTFFIGTSAFAEEHQSDRRTDAQERVEEIKTDRLENVDEKRVERIEKLTEKRIERVLAYAERIVRRFNAAIERLIKLADRIDSRIEKLEEKGFDLTDASTLVGEARVEISNTQTEISGLMFAIGETLESNDPKEAFKTVRAILGEAKTSIKSAHASLVEAIREIKASKDESSDDESNDDESNEDAE